MFFRRKKQEPSTTNATGSPGCCDNHPNPVSADELPGQGNIGRGIISVKQDRHTGAQQKLISSILSSDLDPAALTFVHKPLDTLSENREILIVTDPDLIPSINKLLDHK